MTVSNSFFKIDKFKSTQLQAFKFRLLRHRLDIVHDCKLKIWTEN